MSDPTTWAPSGSYVFRDVNGYTHRVTWAAETRTYADDPGYTFHDVRFSSSFGVKGALITSHDFGDALGAIYPEGDPRNDDAIAWIDLRTLGDSYPAWDAWETDTLAPGAALRFLLRGFESCADALAEGVGSTYGPGVGRRAVIASLAGVSPATAERLGF